MKAADTSSEKKDGKELQSESGGGDDDDDESGDGGGDNSRRKMIVTRASRRQCRQDTNISEGVDGGKKEVDEGFKTTDVKDVNLTEKYDRKKRQPPPINNKSWSSDEKTLDKNSTDGSSVTRANETMKNENTLAVTTRSGGRNGHSVTTSSKAVTRTKAIPTMKSSARFKATKKKKRKRKKCNEWQMYDESGCLISTGIDMCDCLDMDCPGCHFPCLKCGSEKCGTECRCERPWLYEEVKIEGSELVIINPTLENKMKSN
ncbi:uncharacterized protein LOC106870970 [Octopus bimaculoides]|uniref:ARF7 effector protein C-terminal domain-containing protein n=1 Tax=Octopus bimaculoides TaxID=37653 RepID=A0A0L8HFT4_OCTBM|nr:uncharacterized protein LOC106870970 [Octopus bimaculoides]|eukprot:XP_014772703.1 PREDICTED: uncharacterized protein LOC106870970 [Octopus bimaculoides]